MSLRRRGYLVESVTDEALFDAIEWYVDDDRRLYPWFVRQLNKHIDAALLKRHYDEERRGGKLKGMSYKEWVGYKVGDTLEHEGYGVVKKIIGPFLKKIQMGPPGSSIRKKTTFTPESLVALHKEETGHR